MLCEKIKRLVMHVLYALCVGSVILFVVAVQQKVDAELIAVS